MLKLIQILFFKKAAALPVPINKTETSTRSDAEKISAAIVAKLIQI